MTERRRERVSRGVGLGPTVVFMVLLVGAAVLAVALM
jgi:hypothetical protein